MAAEERGSQTADIKIVADAYLFDTRAYREGKPTTVRLEVFVTDSVVGLGGRAYLGKGALKGRLTGDSLTVYFPSSNEFVQGRLDEIIKSSACPFALGDLNILSLFHRLPDSLDLGANLAVEADWEDEDRPRYAISQVSCDWQLNLSYDFRDGIWRIREFEFTNGEELRLKGNRREYKVEREVKAEKFRVLIPPEALRVTL